MTDSKLFNKGEMVQEPGKYVCVPCGYHHEYQAGEKFGECISCLAGTDQGHEDFVEGLEMWEKESILPSEQTKEKAAAS